MHEVSFLSLRDSQYNCLKNLKMRHVFKAMELLVDWMKVGMYDFCSLPFSLKEHMSGEDRERLHSIRERTQDKGRRNDCSHVLWCI